MGSKEGEYPPSSYGLYLFAYVHICFWNHTLDHAIYTYAHTKKKTKKFEVKYKYSKVFLYIFPHNMNLFKIYYLFSLYKMYISITK